MLNYQSLSNHDGNYARETLGQPPAPEFVDWLAKIGVTDEAGRMRAGASVAGCSVGHGVDCVQRKPVSRPLSLRAMTDAQVALGRAGGGGCLAVLAGSCVGAGSGSVGVGSWDFGADVGGDGGAFGRSECGWGSGGVSQAVRSGTSIGWGHGVGAQSARWRGHCGGRLVIGDVSELECRAGDGGFGADAGGAGVALEPDGFGDPSAGRSGRCVGGTDCRAVGGYRAGVDERGWTG